MAKDVILTGIRSNEEPTLANYLGAFVPMVEMQRQFAGQYQINMFVPDLHSFTTPTDHESLYGKTLQNLKYFIAAGLDLNNPDTYIYRQSYIPAHSEMTWILNCFTYVGEMQRMIQFKDKSSEHAASVSMGLMDYPVLMAADILLYGAKWVPVGEDQFQHVEITRDIALRMNNKFGELFVVPEDTAKQTEFMSRDSGLRIRSLSNPTKKMSKSSNDQKSKINLMDDPRVAAKKVMAAATDSVGEINSDWETQPGVTNLLQLLSLLSARDQGHINAEWEGRTSYGDLKKAVAEQVEQFLTNFQKLYHLIDDDVLMQKLEADEAAMCEVANSRLLHVQQAVGLRPKA